MRPKVLVVEDDIAMQALLKEYLESAYIVVTAGTGKQALKQLKEVSFKAVLVDLGLPDLGGLELVRYMEKNHKRTPVIVITGDKTVETVQEAIKLGADDYIGKPVDNTILHKRIEKAATKKLFKAAKKA